MKLVDILEKAFCKMPNGWDETIKVDLTNGWTAPSDGLLSFEAWGREDVAYVSNGKNKTYIAVYAFAGGRSTSSNVARKGETYKIVHKGANITETYAYFTPFPYRGGYLSRLVNHLQSLFSKGVIA